MDVCEWEVLTVNKDMLIFNEDCMEGMKRYPDKEFDLAIVDPPYGIGASGFGNGTNLSRTDGWHREESTALRLKKNRLNQGSGKLKNRVLNQSNCEWDTQPPTAEYFREVQRVSVNQIIWGGNYFDLPPTRGMVCWDKCQPWENFSQFELAWTSFDRPARMFRYSNTGGANAERKIHPTQKPVALYEWLLKNYAKEGDKIIDTHGGSMSIAIACFNMGYDLTVFEIDEDYFNSATIRLEEHKKQQRMF